MKLKATWKIKGKTYSIILDVDKKERLKGLLKKGVKLEDEK